MLSRRSLVFVFCLAALSVSAASPVDNSTPSQSAQRAVKEAEEEEVKGLVVMIDCRLDGNDSWGAGIIFGFNNERIYIVTANHVVRNGTEEAVNLLVQFRSLPNEPIEAKLLRSFDKDLDLAVLAITDWKRRSINVESLSFDRAGETSAIKRGEAVFSLGYPNQKAWYLNVQEDKVSERKRDSLVYEPKFIAKGHSGGPLLNDKRQIIGLIKHAESQAPQGEAIDIEKVLERLEEWGYPVKLRKRSAATGFALVSAGSSHTCGVTANGVVYCWGDNRYGQLGNDSTATSYTPVEIVGGLKFASVSVSGHPIGSEWPNYSLHANVDSYGYSCGLTTNGAVYCWGNSGDGQLGNRSRQSAFAPTPVSDGLIFKSISAGLNHACGLTMDGIPYCWGHVFNWEYDFLAPVRIGSGTFQSLSAGHWDNCSVRNDGAVSCWGTFHSKSNANSKLTWIIEDIPGKLNFVMVSNGTNHACGITTNSATYCWGSNEKGQLGDNSTTSGKTPVLVLGRLTFKSVSAGASHTCGITANGIAYCWGYNNDGRLGNGTTANSLTPVRVSGGLTFGSISAGGSHTCGITTDKTIYCWGSNRFGQLGNGSTTTMTTPTPVSGLP